MVGGGAVVGSGLLAKAAVVLATGIAAGGRSFGAVQAADRVGSNVQVADAWVAQPTVAARKSLSPSARLVSRSADTAPTWMPVGRVAKPSGARSGSTGAAAAPANRPAVAPVDRGGTAVDAAPPRDSGESRPATPRATTPVAETTAIVTSVVPARLPIPAVSSPVQPPVTPEIPAVPQLPTIEPPALPKLP